MGRAGRRAWVVAAAALLAGGCGYSHRPYGRDPLVLDGRAVWGDRDRAHLPPRPRPEPAPPPAPAGPGPLAAAPPAPTD